MIPKILQLVYDRGNGYICGLGEDNKMYVWDTETGNWVLYIDENTGL